MRLIDFGDKALKKAHPSEWQKKHQHQNQNTTMHTDPSSENSSQNKESTATSSPAGSHVSPIRAKAISLCAATLFVGFFFLPWIRGREWVSGYQMQQLGGSLRWLWLIPIFSGLTLLAVMTKRCQKIASRLTGALPFIALAYWLNQLGIELLRILNVGVWLSLISGLALLILSHRSK